MAHLVHYHWAILNIARGEPVSDTGLHAGAARDDAGSMPTGDAKQYPSKAARRDAYLAGHEQFDATLAARSDDQLARPVGLSRWAEAFGDSGQALQYLMVFHESTHIGEIMAWRRARGLPAADD